MGKKSIDSQKSVPCSKRLYAKVCGKLDKFVMTGNRITNTNGSYLGNCRFFFPDLTTNSDSFYLMHTSLVNREFLQSD
mgnify:CR=1 FL=1